MKTACKGTMTVLGTTGAQSAVAAAALIFIKTATPGKVCNLILRFSHAVEQSLATAEIANSEASRLRTQIRGGSGQGGVKRKDLKAVSRAWVLTMGEGIAMVEEMDQDRMSTGKASLRRPSVTPTSSSGSLAILQGGPECDLKLLSHSTILKVCIAR